LSKLSFSALQSHFDLTERFRKVARPSVDEVLGWHFVIRFSRQMELEKSLEVVVASRTAGGCCTAHVA
jgi:hypothetical protein